jgi:hypothetical protein
MKAALVGIVTLIAVSVAGCANMGPVSARQRAEAATDVPEDHPHPPARVVPLPGDGSYNRLKCWDNGQDTVCSRSGD